MENYEMFLIIVIMPVFMSFDVLISFLICGMLKLNSFAFPFIYLFLTFLSFYILTKIMKGKE